MICTLVTFVQVNNQNDSDIDNNCGHDSDHSKHIHKDNNNANDYDNPANNEC